MPPNLDSPSGTLDNSTSIQLEQIEQTLRKLQKNTLKIERRNQVIIRTLEKDRTINSTVSERRIKGDDNTSNDIQHTRPSKPPRKPKSISDPDIEKVLKDVRNQLQNDFQRNREHLELMKKEDEKFSNSLKSCNSNSSNTSFHHNNPVVLAHSSRVNPVQNAFGLFSGIKASFKRALTKISYTGDLDIKNNVSIKTAPIPKPQNQSKKENDKEENGFVLLDYPDGMFKTSPTIRQSTPKPKPRIPRRQTQVASSSKELKQDESITYEKLKELYQNVTEEDDSTLSLMRPPVPKPRIKSTVRINQEPLKTSEDDQNNSGLDESTSEFEYIMAPLFFKTVEIDSDESLVKSDEFTKLNASFVKNLKPSQLPRAYRKKKNQEDIIITDISGSKKGTQSKRPSSPVLKKIPRKPSLKSLSLSNLDEEETLKVPFHPRSKTPPPPPPPNNYLYPKLSQSDIFFTESALISGITISPISIPVHPWIPTSHSKFDICVPDPMDEEHNPKSNNSYNNSDQGKIIDPMPEENSEETDVSIEITITESFAFLESDKNTELDNTDRVQILTNASGNENNMDVLTKTIDQESLPEVWQLLLDQVQESDYVTEKANSCLSFAPVIIESNAFTHEEISRPDSPEGLDIPSFSKEMKDKVLEQETLSPPLPPPPPPPPEIPLYLDTGKRNKNGALPITPLDDTYSHGTIFENLSLGEANEEMQFDLKFIEDNFNISASDSETSTIGGKRPSIGNLNNKDHSEIIPSYISLLSQKRRNAVAICAKRLRNISINTIIKGLKGLNTQIFSADDIQILMQVLPKEDEKSIFEAADCSIIQNLSKEDNFLKQLSGVPRASTKVETINYILGFEETIRTFESDMEILESATESVKESRKFPKILEVILMIINKTFVKESEPLKAFEIQSLQRLASKKSSNGKGTLLQYIVKCLETNFPDILSFYEDFKRVEEASRISKSDCNSFLKEAEKGLESVKEEIKMIQTEAKGQDTIDGLSEVLSFVSNSTLTLYNLKKRWETALSLLSKLMTYFGVPSKQEMDIKDFFGMILTLINDFKKASTQNEQLFPKLTTLDKRTSESSVVMRNKNHRLSLHQPQVTSNADSTDNVLASTRRQSLGNLEPSANLVQQMRQDSGQPIEFLDAIMVIGGLDQDQLDADRMRIRRRSSLYTPYPYRKRMRPSTDNENSNRERKF